MKKHIKKKFLNEFELPEQLKSNSSEHEAKITAEDISKLKIDKNSIPYLLTDSVAFQAFPYKYQGRTCLIPEPDPVLVYFHMAYVNYCQIANKRKTILKPLTEPVMGEPMINDWYEYFGLASGFVIFLFTTLEAFINRCLPKEYEYKRIDNKKTEIYNKWQVQEYIAFNEKIKIILPEIKKKDFYRDHPPTAQHITNLKEFRDDIIHTKTSKDSVTYDHLFKRALNFKYEETINAVASFCNYYHPDGKYIVECDCASEF